MCFTSASLRLFPPTDSCFFLLQVCSSGTASPGSHAVSPPTTNTTTNALPAGPFYSCFHSLLPFRPFSEAGAEWSRPRCGQSVAAEPLAFDPFSCFATHSPPRPLHFWPPGKQIELTRAVKRPACLGAHGRPTLPAPWREGQSVYVGHMPLSEQPALLTCIACHPSRV